MFMRQTAVSIVIASKSAPITSPTISSENGEIAAVRRAITFLSGRFFSERCEWARTSQISARVRPRPKNRRRLQEEQVPELKPLPLRQRVPLHQLHLPLPLQRHLHPAVRREQHPRGRLGIRRQQRRQPRRPARLQPYWRHRLRRHLPLRVLCTHRRRHRDNGPVSLRRHPDRWRTLLRGEAVLSHRLRKLPVPHGPSRQRACRQCILPRGITCIYMRRAASILIRTCRRIGFSTENGG